MRSNEIRTVLEEIGNGNRTLARLLRTLQKRAQPLLCNLLRVTHKGKHGSATKGASGHNILLFPSMRMRTPVTSGRIPLSAKEARASSSDSRRKNTTRASLYCVTMNHKGTVLRDPIG